MKTHWRHSAGGTAIIALSSFMTLAVLAQIAAPPKAEPRTKVASYYSAQRPQNPPLPFNPFPELPLYALDEHRFVFDDREVDYEQLFREFAPAPLLSTSSFDRGAALDSLGDCASELLVSKGSNTVTLTITNAAAGKFFDLFRAYELTHDSITNSSWQWMARGSNGQSFTFPATACGAEFYVLGCTNDSDDDGLSDAFEALVGPDWPPYLTLARDCQSYALILTNLPSGEGYDIFRTFDPADTPVTNAFWFWMAHGTNGQSSSFSNCPCRLVRYLVGSTNDTDGDGLSDAFEVLVNKTSPSTNYSVNAFFTDREMVNVLVNDPEQDCGNEQNTQFESTCAVLGTNVIVAYVDSNRGVYGLGDDTYWYLTNRTPRLVGYAVSTNGGSIFEDQNVPPLSRAGAPKNDDGDAGDPVLAVDETSQVVYLVGTSPRNQGNTGIPLWRSTNAGVTFGQPLIVGDGVPESDKPWVAVDNFVGAGQHDVYLCFTGKDSQKKLHLAVSTNGSGGGFPSQPILIRKTGTNGVSGLSSCIVQVGPDHTGYLFWFERVGSYTNGTNWLMTRQILNRGAATGEFCTVQQLVTTNWINGNLELKRSQTATNDDWFNAWPFPVPAVNPATNRAGHVYVAYADKGENAGDKADIFLVCSTNHGATWTSRVRVNTVWTNDQWMPVLAVKPDGTQLFLAWYDRRNDTSNSLIDVYGCWGAIEGNGNVTLTNEFRINTVSFPPVFAGTRGETEPIYKQPGYYDPVYPPGNVNLHWWYPEWPTPPDPPESDPGMTADMHKAHVSEYNGAWARDDFIYMTWTDSRLRSQGSCACRNQSDVRLVRLSWQQ